MSLDAALEAHTQLAECCQPSVRSLDHPAMTPEPVVALDAPAGDAVLNATALEMVAAAMEVVALVSVQALGPASWPARQLAARSSASSIRCSWCHTPAAC